jgi:acetylglutamate kinase
MDKLYVIKIGGDVIDDAQRLRSFVASFATLPGRKLLVHGGGKLATQMASQLGIQQQMVDGRRITDAETLKVVTMVYGGLINKQIVALLQAEGVNAIGLTGADANALTAHKRKAAIDYGFVGDVDEVNAKFFQLLLEQSLVPVLAPLTHDGQGQMLNTNADTIAKVVAVALSSVFDVHLVFSFNKAGVLLDSENDSSVLPELSQTMYAGMKEKNQVYAGMLPKLDNAFDALSKGVQKLTIGNAAEITNIIENKAGTKIIHG